MIVASRLRPKYTCGREVYLCTTAHYAAKVHSIYTYHPNTIKLSPSCAICDALIPNERVVPFHHFPMSNINAAEADGFFPGVLKFRTSKVLI